MIWNRLSPDQLKAEGAISGDLDSASKEVRCLVTSMSPESIMERCFDFVKFPEADMSLAKPQKRKEIAVTFISARSSSFGLLTTLGKKWN